MDARNRRVTVPALMAMKSAGRKISMLTAYDFPTARMLDAAGIDAILIGDTLGMVVQGHATTLPVTLDQMIYHAEMVSRAVGHALVIADMPFASYQQSVDEAIANAARILKETGCQAVKLESGPDQAIVIAALVRSGIPVMAHCGLRPQSIHQFGGYRVQRDREQLTIDAAAMAEAGAFAIVLECIPAEIAAEITRALRIPTIGIGAGPGCDGQVLVIHDVLGLTTNRVPRHAKVYADLAGTVSQAVARYCAEVRDGTFPGVDQTST